MIFDRNAKPSIYEWHDYFAWIPKPVIQNGQAYWVWLETIERKRSSDNFEYRLKRPTCF